MPFVPTRILPDRVRRDLAERGQDVLMATAAAFLNRRPGATQPWRTVRAADLIRVHREHAAFGFVARGLEEIAGAFVENVLALEANTVLAGHTEADPAALLADEFPGADFEGIEDWISDGRGGWRISDFGLDALHDLSLRLLCAEDDGETLAILSAMLGVAHQRSDLAANFVEGGSRTLDVISR